jgi:plasmid stability protein
MAKTLIVRQVDEKLVRRFKLRAARNDRSAEAENREILKQALSGEPNAEFKEIAAQLRADPRTPPYAGRGSAPRSSRRALSGFVVDASVAIKWLVDEPGAELGRLVNVVRASAPARFADLVVPLAALPRARAARPAPGP